MLTLYVKGTWLEKDFILYVQFLRIKGILDDNTWKVPFLDQLSPFHVVT